MLVSAKLRTKEFAERYGFLTVTQTKPTDHESAQDVVSLLCTSSRGWDMQPAFSLALLMHLPASLRASDSKVETPPKACLATAHIPFQKTTCKRQEQSKELFFVGSKSAGQTCLADEMQDGKCEVVMPVAFPDEGPRSLGLRGKFGVHPKQMQCRSASTVLLRKGGARRCQGRSRLWALWEAVATPLALPQMSTSEDWWSTGARANLGSRPFSKPRSICHTLHGTTPPLHRAWNSSAYSTKMHQVTTGPL